MAENSNRFGSFMSQTVPVKRWKFYRVQFVGLCLGWLAIQDILQTSKFKIATALLFAAAVCAFNCWSELRRSTNPQETSTK